MPDFFLPKLSHSNALPLDRRRVMLVLGGAGASLLAGTRTLAQTFDCVLSPEMTEGPYWVDEKLNRSDIRSDVDTGAVKPGVPLTLAITVQSILNTACAPLAGATVDIWHCDALGSYSDVAQNGTSGQDFLRGYQISDSEGKVNFTTLYPGWYRGRTVHIHLRVRTYDGSTVLGNFASQLFFDDTITDQVFASNAPYNTRGSRDTRNAADNIYGGQARTLLNLTQTSEGYAASINVGVDLENVGVPKPALAEGGIVSAASYASGVAPQSWVSIFGTNLATTTRAAVESDLIDGSLPTTLGGVSVSINNQPAFVQYVSPTQINVEAPNDSALGPVSVTVTNTGGTSDARSANLSARLPAFFVSQNYVAAVRSDGVIITGVESSAEGSVPAAKSGDMLQLYGTGFGETDPAVAPGLVFEGAYPLTENVMITIGDLPATVSFAGLVAAGLYQFNVTVPALPNGDHKVVAAIAGISTQENVLLKIET